MELARRRPVADSSQRDAAAEAAALLRSFYYPKQAAFFRSRAKRRATSKTRRAGATTGGCIELIARSIEHPGHRATIVHSTRTEARQRAWLSDTRSGLVDILRKYGTPIDHPSVEVQLIGGVRADIRDQAMTINFSNGSQIDMFGFDDERAMRKQRGNAKHVYWIDEAQDVRFLDRFYDAVIIAALSDYRGECWLSGTPGQDCVGMFYDITKDSADGPPSPGWEVHTIAVIDNPFFGRVTSGSEDGRLIYYVEDSLGAKHGPYTTYAEAETAAGQARWDRTAGATLLEKNWTGDEPDFIREWLGKWSKVDARFVYPVHAVSPYDLLYAPERRAKNPIANSGNHVNPLSPQAGVMWCDFKKAITDLPKRNKSNQKRQWMYAISADFGYHPDPFAIVVWAFAHDTQDVYELFSWKAQKVHTDDQGAYLKAVWDALDNVVVLVGDPAGKQDDFEVWRTRLQLPIDEANKKGKNTLEEFLADDIRRGRVHLRHDSVLYDEMKHLVYLPTKPGKTREAAKHRKASDGRMHGDHACLVAGTLVTTDLGEFPIEQVMPRDAVRTRSGWHPVTRAWRTGAKPVYRVTFDDGRYIDGTPDHPFWTQDGWKQLADLTPHDTFITCDLKSFATKESATGGTPNTPIDPSACTFAAPVRSVGEATSSTCTEQSGQTLMGPFPTTTTSTISTRIPSTTPSTTCRQCPGPNICSCTVSSPSESLSPCEISRSPDPARQRGTVAPLASRGIASTDDRLWNAEHRHHSFVHAARLVSSPSCPPRSSAQVAAGLQLDALAESITSIENVRFAPPSSESTGTPSSSVARIRVLRVESLHYEADVFNITVDGEHEFFANGILVSNCDAARYGYEALTHYLSKLPKDMADKGTPGELHEEAERLEKQLDDREKRRAEELADGDEAYLDSLGGNNLY